MRKTRKVEPRGFFSLAIIIRWRHDVFVCFDVDVDAGFTGTCAVVRRDRYIVMVFRNHYGIGIAMLDDRGFVMQQSAVVNNGSTVVIGNHNGFISQSRCCGEERRDRQG